MFLSEGVREKDTLSLDGFLLYSLFCVLPVFLRSFLCSSYCSYCILFFSIAYILQQGFSGNMGITMWLHSIFQVNEYNEYR